MEQGFIARSPNAGALQEQKARVKDKPRANFKLFHQRDDWQVDQHGALVPVLSHMSMAPGAGAEPSGDFGPHQRRLEEKGWIAIPHDVLSSLGWDDYVTAYVNHRGKDVCRSIFQTPQESSAGATQWHADEQAVNAFIALLRQRGLIPAPRPRIVAELLHREQRRYQYLADHRPDERNHAGVARHRLKTSRCERAIENLERELEASIAVYGRDEAPVRTALLGSLREAADHEQQAQQAVADLGAKLRSTTRAPSPKPAPKPAPKPSKPSPSKSKKAEPAAEGPTPRPLELATEEPTTESSGGFVAHSPNAGGLAELGAAGFDDDEDDE